MGYVFESKKKGFTSQSGDILEPIKKKKDIIKNLQQVYDQFENLVGKTDMLIDEKFLKRL